MGSLRPQQIMNYLADFFTLAQQGRFLILNMRAEILNEDNKFSLAIEEILLHSRPMATKSNIGNKIILSLTECS